VPLRHRSGTAGSAGFHQKCVTWSGCSDTAGSTGLQLTCRTGFESRLQQPCTHPSSSTVYSTVPVPGDWVQSSVWTMRFTCMWGVPKAGGLCVIHKPYALTYCTTLNTFEETQRCQLYHYDVVVIQLAAWVSSPTRKRKDIRKRLALQQLQAFRKPNPSAVTAANQVTRKRTAGRNTRTKPHLEVPQKLWESSWMRNYLCATLYKTRCPTSCKT
jgi:hypothetical protein